MWQGEILRVSCHTDGGRIEISLTCTTTHLIPDEAVAICEIGRAHV